MVFGAGDVGFIRKQLGFWTTDMGCKANNTDLGRNGCLETHLINWGEGNGPDATPVAAQRVDGHQGRQAPDLQEPLWFTSARVVHGTDHAGREKHSW